MTRPIPVPPRKDPQVRTRTPLLPPQPRSRAALQMSAAAARGALRLQHCAACGYIQLHADTARLKRLRPEGDHEELET